VCVLALLLSLSFAGPALAQTERKEKYTWQLPYGFPRPPIPKDNPMSAAKVELGRLLFYDRRLSITGDYSCGSCHQQALAFTDGLTRARGASGDLHPRSAMSLTNVAYNSSYGWGESDLPTLEAQARIPLLNEAPIEIGLAGRTQEVLDTFAADVDYAERFALAFPREPEPATLDNLIRALASFERTLVSGDSPYDRLLFLDDRGALSEKAVRGMRLFFSGRIGCSECHGGLNLSGATPVGRAPTLRNIERTRPYMRDGSVPHLEGVIDLYARGDPFPNRPDRGGLRGFTLEPRERRALVAFLESLTDERFLQNPRFGDPFEAGVVSGAAR
jgi:cytochrome c peroxidase